MTPFIYYVYLKAQQLDQTVHALVTVAVDVTMT